MTNLPESRADIEEVDGDTPPPRRIRLETIDQIRVEMARVYRDARGGKVPPDIASKFTYMLVQIAKVTEAATIETRLREIEERLEKGPTHGIEHKG